MTVLHPRAGLLRAFPVVLALLGGMAFGSIAAGYSLEAVGIPYVLLLILVTLFVTTPFILRFWSLGVAAFFSWLIIEDLVRKLSGNDLRIYVVKDLLFVLILVALLADARVRAAAHRVFRLAGLPLLSLIGWAVVLSVPTAFTDWRPALLGLKLNFAYVPLVFVGFVIGSDAARLRRWLVGLGLVTAAGCAVGIAQALVGPNFLAPDRVTPGLDDLALYRDLQGQVSVFQPAGSFASPGRFGALATITVALGLMLVLSRTRDRTRVIGYVVTLAGTAAAWFSSFRSSVLIAAGLVVFGLLAPVVSGNRRARGAGLVGVALACGTLALISSAFPAQFDEHTRWYRKTLNPRSSVSVWERVGPYYDSLTRGIEVGGIMGDGTGRHSLGNQYLFHPGEARQAEFRSRVEGGLAGIAIEWGIVGLVLWLVWALSWTGKQCKYVRALRGSPMAPAGVVIVGWSALLLFFRVATGSAFQDYLTNAYFWLFSGLLFGLFASHTSDQEDERAELVVTEHTAMA